MSVWILLILLKTENTNKIIFKCVNSAMGSFFNEKNYLIKRFVGPVNITQDPLNSVIPVKIWIVKEVMGSVHNARDPLTDTPT